MVSRLFGGKAELTLELHWLDGDESPCEPGETVELEVTVSSDNDTTIDEGYVDLVGVARYRPTGSGEPRPIVVGTPVGAPDTRTPHEHVQERTVFASGAIISAAMSHTFRVSLNIPADTPPTHEGIFINVEWLARAVVKARRAGDVSGCAELVVRPVPPSSSPEDIEEETSNSYKDCTLTLSLAPVIVSPGDSISCDLEVQPRAYFAATEIRAELTSWEQMGMRTQVYGMHGALHEKAELAERTDFKLGMTRRFPFSFTLPGNFWPSMKSRCATRIWLVSATLMMEDGSPCRVERELEVCAPTPTS